MNTTNIDTVNLGINSFEYTVSGYNLTTPEVIQSDLSHYQYAWESNPIISEVIKDGVSLNLKSKECSILISKIYKFLKKGKIKHSNNLKFSFCFPHIDGQSL